MHSSFSLVKFAGVIQDIQQFDILMDFFLGVQKSSSSIIIQSCQKFDFPDANIPSEERKALVAVVNLTDDTGRQMFSSKTSSFTSLSFGLFDCDEDW